MSLDPDRPYLRPQQVLVDDRTHSELGPDGVAMALAHLWLGDCQTCNRPLGAEPPSLIVADYGAHVEGSLHHGHCRSPAWNDRIILEVEGTASFLYRPFTTLHRQPDGTAAQIAAVLVNPAVERVMLARDGGVWRLRRHTDFGFARFDRTAPLRRHPDAVARSFGHGTGSHHDVLDVYLGGERQWRFALGRDAMSAVREHRGLMILASQAVDPDACRDAEHMSDHLRDLVGRDVLDAVWAAYDRPPAATDPAPQVPEDVRGS